MHLIVGLGNPGSKYHGTRHNAGFEVVETLAEEAQCRFEEHVDQALLAEGRLQETPVALAKPLSYMNRSGQVVKNLLRRCRAVPAELLVVVDDIHLPPGTIRLRASGSAGGHNGMQDVIDRLGTKAFPRLRVGIGDDFPNGELVDYVLSPFSREQRPLMREALARSREAVGCFVAEGIEAAMNQFNG